MTPSRKKETGAVRLAKRIKEGRHAMSLTQERLASVAGELDTNRPVSVDTVRQLERQKDARSLPRRRSTGGKLTLESIAMALNIDLPELLLECFSDQELKESCFGWVIDKRDLSRVKYKEIIAHRTLDEFIVSLPTDAQSLLDLPNVLQIRNAEAFAYIFALERQYTGREMLIVNEPPLIFLDSEDIQKWAKGMKLGEEDADTFQRHLKEYQTHFRELVLDGTKIYQIVLGKQPFLQFLAGKSKHGALGMIEYMVSILRNCRNFEMVFVETHDQLEEFEVMSRHQTIPVSLSETLSVVIRQTSMSAAEVEYRLVPMPASLSGLQRDIAKIEQAWALALDQYASIASGGNNKYWSEPSKVTIQLLGDLVLQLG
jgi:transcriptional regulator with XRE-family HTH domain